LGWNFCSSDCRQKSKKSRGAKVPQKISHPFFLNSETYYVKSPSDAGYSPAGTHS